MIERDYYTQYTASYFMQMKDNNVTWFLVDFRKLNQNLVRILFPLLRIGKMLQSLRKFACISKLNLSMGYYHFLLENEAKRLETIRLSWRNCYCNWLHMGTMIMLDAF